MYPRDHQAGEFVPHRLGDRLAILDRCDNRMRQVPVCVVIRNTEIALDQLTNERLSRADLTKKKKLHASGGSGIACQWRKPGAVSRLLDVDRVAGEFEDRDRGQKRLS